VGFRPKDAESRCLAKASPEDPAPGTRNRTAAPPLRGGGGIRCGAWSLGQGFVYPITRCYRPLSPLQLSGPRFATVGGHEGLEVPDVFVESSGPVSFQPDFARARDEAREVFRQRGAG